MLTLCRRSLLVISAVFVFYLGRVGSGLSPLWSTFNAQVSSYEMCACLRQICAIESIIRPISANKRKDELATQIIIILCGELRTHWQPKWFSFNFWAHFEHSDVFVFIENSLNGKRHIYRWKIGLHPELPNIWEEWRRAVEQYVVDNAKMVCDSRLVTLDKHSHIVPSIYVVEIALNLH